MAADIPDGAVIVARAILNSSLWTMAPADSKFAITCICLANWKDRKVWYQGNDVLIRRGQFVRSISQLAISAHLTCKEVRGAIKRLIRAGFLAQERAGVSFVYTVCKYDRYQDLTKYADSEWQTLGTVLGTETGTPRARRGHDAGTTRAGSGHDAGNKQVRQEGEEGEKGEEVRFAPSSATPFGLLLAKAAAAAIPNKIETLRTYFSAWQARSSYSSVEQILMDPWTRGKSVLEIQDHFFPRNGNGKPQEPSRSDANGKTKCLACGGSKTVAADVLNGKIILAPCPRCQHG